MSDTKYKSKRNNAIGQMLHILKIIKKLETTIENYIEPPQDKFLKKEIKRLSDKYERIEKNGKSH